jgi:hypothetical protein
MQALSSNPSIATKKERQKERKKIPKRECRHRPLGFLAQADLVTPPSSSQTVIPVQSLPTLCLMLISPTTDSALPFQGLQRLGKEDRETPPG